jgi:hypothetical protein
MVKTCYSEQKLLRNVFCRLKTISKIVKTGEIQMRVYFFRPWAFFILFSVFCSSAPDYVPKIRFTPGPGPISSEMDKNDKGVGPIISVKLGSFDKSLAIEGDSILNVKCYSCHALEYSNL